eukprot:5871884-Pleurochrysis_carterae.AAC.2
MPVGQLVGRASAWSSYRCAAALAACGRGGNRFLVFLRLTLVGCQYWYCHVRNLHEPHGILDHAAFLAERILVEEVS